MKGVFLYSIIQKEFLKRTGGWGKKLNFVYPTTAWLTCSGGSGVFYLGKASLSQGFLVHLKSSHCGTSSGWGESAEDLFGQCRQSREGQGVWEELAEWKGMRYPHLYKAQDVVSESNQVEAGSKMHSVSLPSICAMQTWEAVHETVVVETCGHFCSGTWTKQNKSLNYVWNIPQLEHVTCLSIQTKVIIRVDACTQAVLTSLFCLFYITNQIWKKIQIAYLCTETIVFFPLMSCTIMHHFPW